MLFRALHVILKYLSYPTWQNVVSSYILYVSITLFSKVQASMDHVIWWTHTTQVSLLSYSVKWNQRLTEVDSGLSRISINRNFSNYEHCKWRIICIVNFFCLESLTYIKSIMRSKYESSPYFVFKLSENTVNISVYGWWFLPYTLCDILLFIISGMSLSTICLYNENRKYINTH